ncbi:hypothetical protein AZ66_20190 [Paenibacillus sp. E194]|uniref:glycosyltransferase family 4 protein n=1 Tax=Paenibacillus sp. E194 TaxID=1458845 RepID=UPI0005C952A8|nr:glycosyltransferase family 4 protein [Paenibacillus sp. E194]KJB86193.1 hypothetical protein AZ66_20190 [Paenibacillus sp. E194]
MNEQLRVLNVYKWATMGGVERVFLNRAHAFQEYGISIVYDVYFLHDSGGREKFKKYIQKYELESNIRVVDDFKEDDYDLILSVDTPEILDKIRNNNKVYMECHTGYKDNRAYIKRLPSDIGGIIVPSGFFKNTIRDEVPNWLMDKIYTLTNFVFASEELINKKNCFWSKVPLVYVGRLDNLKNVEEAIRILAYYKDNISDEFILLLAGPIIQHEIDIHTLLETYNVNDRVVYLPPVDFENVSKLYEMVNAHSGIFISSSKKETFGLSAAEAMINGLPVLLSNIEAHLELVDANYKFVYELGNIKEASSKLAEILENYSEYKAIISTMTKKFSSQQFVEDWNALIGGV